ncbi:MAG: hypothetical protein BGO74_08300 [Burkholderiales bacterium 68-12]|nr:MAG: hypothetical protein BGO74_08300 [Burkholderiales bacterium 68-12]
MYPTEWKVCTLSDVTEKIMVGIASAATHAYCSSGIPMLRNLNIRPGYIDEQDVLQIDSEYELAHRNKRLKTGDVLVVRTGYPGVSAVVPEKYDGAQCFTSLIVRPKKAELSADYFCQYMNSAFGERLSAAAEAGGAQKNLNAGELEKLQLHLPTIQEQHCIAQILSAWDQAIASADRLLQSSLERKRGLARDLLQGKTRSKQFTAPWQQLTFRDVLKEVKRRVEWDDDQEYPLISVRRRSGGAFLRETLKGSEILTKKLNYAYEGEFLISKMQVVHGAMAVVPAALDGMFVSDSYLAFQSADEDRFDINFIGWLSTTQQMYKTVRRCSYGVHIEKMTFDLDMFLNEKLHVPLDLEEQHFICRVLESAQAEVESAVKHLEKLKLEKAALMSQLLTGKRRVKLPDAEAEVQA